MTTYSPELHLRHAEAILAHRLPDLLEDLYELLEGNPIVDDLSDAVEEAQSIIACVLEENRWVRGPSFPEHG